MALVTSGKAAMPLEAWPGLVEVRSLVWRMVKEVPQLEVWVMELCPEQSTEDLVEAERRASGNSQAD